jgi:hypothetical protein
MVVGEQRMVVGEQRIYKWHPYENDHGVQKGKMG